LRKIPYQKAINGNDKLGNGSSYRLRCLIVIGYRCFCYFNNADGHLTGYEGQQHTYKGEEHSVVSPADAGTQPQAVVVKVEHAVITGIAVRRPGRPEDEACLTEFQLE
jgi:hypothetical protein